jgi:phospholipase A1/A2
LVDIRLLNNGATPQAVTLPDRLEARLVVSGAPRSVWLERADETPATLTLSAGGFTRGRYRLIGMETLPEALLSVPAWGEQQVALAAAPAQHPAQLAAASPPAPMTPPVADRSVGNAFLENLSAYEPIYAVYGPGTNSDARIQLSFRYQLYGSRAREDRAPSVRDGLYFAYTQRMFWDVGARSSPFRNIDYQPEIFYLAQPLALSDRATVSGQIGMRHESNGRDGDASRSINSLYVAPMAAFSLGGGWRLTAAPRLWLYVGNRSDNPDIRRYRGNGGLFLEIGQDEGLRLSTTSRFNTDSGKGAISADLSYPLRRILGGGPDFYLFAQSFHGYGENLLDYNKRMTRLRVGLAVVR